MFTKKEKLAGYGLAALGVISLITAPFITIGAAIGGGLGLKAGNEVAKKKYARHDVGGVGKASLLCLSSAVVCAGLGGWLGGELSDTFSKNADISKTAYNSSYELRVAAHDKLEKPQLVA